MSKTKEKVYCYIAMAYFNGDWVVCSVFKDAADAAYFITSRTDVPVHEILDILERYNYFHTAKGLYCMVRGIRLS